MRQQGRRGSDSNFYGQSGGVWPARLGHRVPPLPDTPTPALANGNHTPAGAAVVKRKFHTDLAGGGSEVAAGLFFAGGGMTKITITLDDGVVRRALNRAAAAEGELAPAMGVAA